MQKSDHELQSLKPVQISHDNELLLSQPSDYLCLAFLFCVAAGVSGLGDSKFPGSGVWVTISPAFVFKHVFAHVVNGSVYLEDTLRTSTHVCCNFASNKRQQL
eukprot:5781088-Amphidinium_carterae.1